MEQILIKNADDQTIRAYRLSSESLIIGRQSYCDVVLNNASVSREHAKISKTRDGWIIEDLQSRNGVWVNAKRLNERPVLLSNRDVINIGSQKVVFVSDSQGVSHKKKNSDEDLSNTLSWKDDDFDLRTIKSEVPVGSFSNKDKSKGRLVGSVKEYQREIALLETRLQIMLNLARNLGKASDLLDLAPRFLNDLLRLFPQADAVCVLAPTSDGDDGKDANKVVWRLLDFARRDEQISEPFLVSRAIIKRVATTRAAILSDSVVDDFRFDSSDSIVASCIYSVMAAPIYDTTNDSLIGIVQVDSRQTHSRFGQDDLKLLVAVANQVAVYWENQRYRDSVLKEKLASQEMQVANQVQRGFLPVGPPKVDSYEFYDYYKPAKFVGGDYFDYVPLMDGNIAIILGDVSGKGISASLLMAKLSAEVRFSLASVNERERAMKRLNQAFCENHWGGRFITLVLIILEPMTGIVHLFNAGHLYPLLSKVDGSVEQLGEGFNSFPLGIVAEAEFPEFTYQLKEGEAISLMSDGFPDAMCSSETSSNGEPEAFGEERVRKALCYLEGDNVETLGTRLVSTVRKFADAAHQTDDQCLVIFRRISSNIQGSKIESESDSDSILLSESRATTKESSVDKESNPNRKNIEIEISTSFLKEDQ